jgi:hypothetical protein
MNQQPQTATHWGSVGAGGLSVEIRFIPCLESDEIVTKNLLTLLENTKRIRGIIKKWHT